MFEKLYDALSALPVMDIADEIATSVHDGLVVILSSATGSGKTLVATCKLADKTGEQVVVCVPRRFLAVNAAETICELAGLTIGNEVGYAVGKQSGEQSMMSRETKLLFVTYGYAISSGLVNRAKYIVNDEVHEASMDMSIVRALLYRRLENGEEINLMEMSATIDANRQATYWNSQVPTKIYMIDGRTHPCVRLEVEVGGGITLQGEGEELDPEEALHDYDERKSLENAVEAVVAQETLTLITDHDRKGVLVFRPGVGEVEETADAIKALAKRILRKYVKQVAKEMRRSNRDLSKEEADELLQAAREAHPLSRLEVATIYGEMDYATRKEAVARPKDGHAKVLVGTNVIESGANIPWLDGGVTCGTGKQQVVRESGALSLELVNLSQWRLEQQEGRVKRFCPGMFVLCSDEAWGDRLKETSPEIIRLPLTELVMHCASFGVRTNMLTFDYAPEVYKIEEAEKKLQKLGLIDVRCQMTQSGKWVSGLPVSVETGAMLWYAKQIGVLGAATPLAAVMEVGGVRKDFKFGHHLSRQSDLFDGLVAYKQACEVPVSQRKEFLEEYNIGFKRWSAAKELERDLLKRFEAEDMSAYWDSDGMSDRLRQCILAGQVNQFFVFRMGCAYTSDGNKYRIGQGSAVEYPSTSFVCGTLRTITPRNGNEKFTVIEKVTEIQVEDIEAVGIHRPDLLYTGPGAPEYSYVYGGTIPTRVTSFNGLVIRREQVKTTNVSSLGALLRTSSSGRYNY